MRQTERQMDCMNVIRQTFWVVIEIFKLINCCGKINQLFMGKLVITVCMYFLYCYSVKDNVKYNIKVGFVTSQKCALLNFCNIYVHSMLNSKSVFV